jgi:hypothetical protein
LRLKGGKEYPTKETPNQRNTQPKKHPTKETPNTKDSLVVTGPVSNLAVVGLGCRANAVDDLQYLGQKAAVPVLMSKLIVVTEPNTGQRL